MRGATLVALLSGGACGPSNPTRTEIAPAADARTGSPSQMIGRLEHEWAEAYLRKDLAWYDRHVAKEFRTVSNGQIVSRDEVIEHVRTSPLAKQVKVDQVKVRVYGDTAIALLTESVTNANGNSGKLRMTDVWVKSKAGHWMAVHSHETSLDADKQ